MNNIYTNIKPIKPKTFMEAVAGSGKGYVVLSYTSSPSSNQLMSESLNATDMKSIVHRADALSKKSPVYFGINRRASFRPYIKYYLEGRTKQISNYWDDIEGNKKASLTIKELLGRDVFTNPKPVGLLKKILTISTDKDSIVLDFFAGASTTAHAVMELNSEDGGQRNFIMVQLPEPTPEASEAYKQGFKNIAEISRKRIVAAGNKIEKQNEGQLDAVDLDLGFRAYSLVDSNFSKWRISSDIEANKLEQHILDLRESALDDATPDSLITEILLKQGYSLSEEINQIEISGLKLKSVSDKVVLAYLDEHIKPTLIQLREVIQEHPARFIILEDAFHGDDELKTNLAQECKSQNVELWTV